MVEPPCPSLILVSGPASGGKSRWAEELARRSGKPVTYLATGPLLPQDPSWQERLERHRRRRPAGWQCREVEGALAQALEDVPRGCLTLVDSLGTWVAAHLELEETDWQRECGTLLKAVERRSSDLLIVAEEVGWGVVPASAVGGRFRERLGTLLQELTPRSDAAWLVVQGRAVELLAISAAVPRSP